MTDPSMNIDLNGVITPEGKKPWGKAFPRDFDSQFAGIEPGSVPAQEE